MTKIFLEQKSKMIFFLYSINWRTKNSKIHFIEFGPGPSLARTFPDYVQGSDPTSFLRERERERHSGISGSSSDRGYLSPKYGSESEFFLKNSKL